jgi:hypothetical protein
MGIGLLGVGSRAEEGLLLGPAAVPGPDRQAT